LQLFSLDASLLELQKPLPRVSPAQKEHDPDLKEEIMEVSKMLEKERAEEAKERRAYRSPQSQFCA
jgi:hypothetical protein